MSDTALRDSLTLGAPILVGLRVVLDTVVLDAVPLYASSSAYSVPYVRRQRTSA